MHNLNQKERENYIGEKIYSSDYYVTQFENHKTMCTLVEHNKCLLT